MQECRAVGAGRKEGMWGGAERMQDFACLIAAGSPFLFLIFFKRSSFFLKIK